ncbi:DAGAT-domain-containing protein [Trichocladium antarcticum]|uniref:diacylglycerol O-acyltransferase n=1 Tax=Trichocladium antarcticum TaxID=1450529 RepID=A0AAN6ZBI0_9PEZI|nr:DAGAT-domain-containing protein [Trichocladium antarcticum]
MTQPDHGYTASPTGSVRKKGRAKRGRAKKAAAQKTQQNQEQDGPNGVDAALDAVPEVDNGDSGDSADTAEPTMADVKAAMAMNGKKTYAQTTIDAVKEVTSYEATRQAKRNSVGENADLADSAGDIAEHEADDISVDGVKTPYRQDAVNGTKPGPGRGPPPTTYPPLTNAAGEEAAARERARADAYLAGGIRFAPWNIPYRRRLQTLAVLAHSLSIAMTVSFFFFLCAIPLTWPIVIPYLLHMLLSKSGTDGRLRRRSERFRRLRIWKFFGEYYPAQLHKTHDLLPTRKYIFGYHPHGIISHGAFASFATEALGFADKFPGITNTLLTLDSNFRIPLYRDYILALGLQSVSKESITNILTTGGRNREGMGRAVTIVVGGARESLQAQPGLMNLVLAERKGFIKMAMRTGADLVPVLAFGENDLYDQVSAKQHPRLHRLQMWVLHTLKFTLPFLHGRGIFNYDVGLMPYRRPLNVVVGRPIPVAQARGEVDMREVDRLHRVYVAELLGMWERYKDVFARERRGELQVLK